MALRKNVQTSPQLDGTVTDESSKVVHALDVNGLGTVIRMIRNGTKESVAIIKNVVSAKMTEFTVERDFDQAVTHYPRSGSDQFDGGSFVTWVNKIKADDADSIHQLVVIDATLQIKGPK